ncbi:uncharacterized protein LOC142774471 [Rhipicephalus microplus]|uniref:uncharacterized protein LOC142774471 n=1 Tax=Rhipicephalus microplus TaxID=6941 RepID=UPI003F6D7119
MKRSQEHHGGRNALSKVHKSSPTQSGAHHEEGEGKPIATAPANVARFALSADHEERVKSVRARKKSVAGQSTASRASGTTGKSSQATSKGYLLSTDVRDFIKELAQEEKDGEAHFDRARLRVEGTTSHKLDPFGKLLDQLSGHHDRAPEHDADSTRGIVVRKLLVVLEVLWFHKLLVLALSVTLVSLVAVSLGAYMLFGGHGVAYTASPEPLLSGVLPACRSKECAMALEILNLSMDSSADPCQDAYAMTCGKWRFMDEHGEEAAYKRLIKGRYEWKVHMLLAANSTQSRPELYVPSRIYRSCVSFMTDNRARLTDVLNVSGMDPEKWLAVTNFSELFTLIVDTAMTNRLESIFRIENGTGFPIVATGRSMKTDAVEPIHAIKELFK